MATLTYAQQLESVQTAIAAIEGGAQSYKIKDREWTGADLATLYKREAWLRTMADRETRGGIRVRGVTPIN